MTIATLAELAVNALCPKLFPGWNPVSGLLLSAVLATALAGIGWHEHCAAHAVAYYAYYASF